MEGTVEAILLPNDGAGAVEEIVELAILVPGQFIACDELSAGMVGYITASIKMYAETRVGDTITDNNNPAAEPTSWI